MLPVPDLVAAIFLGIFLFGFGFSAVSWLLGLGGAHVDGHHPLAGGHGAHLEVGHGVHVEAAPASEHPNVHAGVGGGAHHGVGGHEALTAHGHAGGAGQASQPATAIAVINVMTVTGFLTWFGAAGYVAYALNGVPLPLTLLVAGVGGLAGGYLVYLFLFKFLLRGQTTMNAAEYRLIGTLARVSVPIGVGGIGEVVFAKAGRRRSEGARSVDGVPLARGTEVVIVGYERGLALVQEWQRLIESGSEAPPPRSHE